MVRQKRSGKSDPSRRGAILVWSAVIMTFMLAMTAFAMDISYMTVVATQLQNAADAAALSGVVELPKGNAVVIATAQEVASKNNATTEIVTINAADVEFGWYDTSARKFTMKRSATAILNPRDIAFAVDLSGSMNDDAEPCWATNQIAPKTLHAQEKPGGPRPARPLPDRGAEWPVQIRGTAAPLARWNPKPHPSHRNSGGGQRV